MPTGQLFLNEEEISLKPDTLIAITFQVADVASVENRKGNGSNSFHVPKTQSNIRKLGHSDKVTSLSTLPYSKLPARYSQKGIQIVKSGFAIISESATDFEITLYDGNTPFFDLIDKKKLQDLDFSSLDHVWNRTNITGFITNTSDIIYPIVDYGSAPYSFAFGGRLTEVNVMLPWIFLHTVVEKIFEGTGYTFSGSFIDSSLYANLLINLPTLKADETKFIGSASAATTTVLMTPSFSQIGYVLFDTIISDPLQASLPPGVLEITGGYTQYNILSPGNYSFKAVLGYTIVDTVSTFLQIAIHGSLPEDFLAQGDEILSSGTGTQTLLAEGIDLVAGDKITVRIVSAQTSGHSGSVTIAIGSTFESTSAQTTVIFGTWLPVAINLPDMTQKDLLKAVMQMYCIIPITNTLTRNVHFVQFGEIVANKFLAPDWTDKIDMSVQDKLTFRAGSYAQVNNLRYSPESSQAPEIGDGSFSVADTTLDLERDLLTLPFAATEMRKRFNGIDTPFDLRLDVTTLEWMDGTPRILILEKTDLNPDYFDYHETGVGGGQNTNPENLVYFSLPGKTDNLAFSDNLISKHYADFVRMLNSYKKITVAMKLTAVDIEALDFSIPVYLNQFSAYFFINKIEQWIDHSTQCIVELVKID